MGREMLGFSYREQGSDILILRNGSKVTLLRGVQAEKFRLSVDGLDAPAAQQLMARATGNYKRGNERHARQRRSR